MPIVDIEIVGPRGSDTAQAPAQSLADALGRVFDSQPGRTWVRMRRLDAAAYAENGTSVEPAVLPVFVTVLEAYPETGEALAAEVRAVTAAVAAGLECPVDRVHVQYAPAAAGRQAFGGRLVE